jgi:hypothetical protein
MENTTQTETTAAPVHAFEAAGLGKAPFKYVGAIKQDIAYGEAVVSREGGILVTTKRGGSCDFCGTYIVNMFRIKSADGRTFKVGEDCVLKTGDAGLKKVVAAAVSKLRSAQTVARETTKKAEGAEFLGRDDVKAFMASAPHPLAWRAEKGDTLADYAEWMLKNAGTKGKLALFKKIRAEFEAATA